MEKQRYHVIGAGRGIGRWFVRQLTSLGHEVHCFDVRESLFDGLPAEAARHTVDDDHPYSSYSGNFRPSDSFLLAIPQSVLPTINTELVPHLDSESLLICLTSVQREPLRILDSSNLTIPILGCHPLFGPTVPSPIGQMVALTNFDDSALLHRKFRDEVRRLGLIPSTLTPDDHDRYMGVVQALTHFSFLVFAKCLSNLSSDPSTLFNLRTPNFQFLHAFTCRYLRIAPTTTGAIQFAPEAKGIRSAFVEAATDLAENLDASHTIDDAADVVGSTREPFDGFHVDEGAQVAALAVDALQRFERLIHRHATDGTSFVFRHRLSGFLHVVKITENNPMDIAYEERSQDYDGKLAIGLDDISRKNYSRIGIVFGKPTCAIVKKRNIGLLSGDELAEFWRSRILPLSLQLNVSNPHSLKETFFDEWIPRLIRGVHQSTFQHSFRKRDHAEKVTIEIVYDARYDASDLATQINNLAQEFTL